MARSTTLPLIVALVALAARAGSSQAPRQLSQWDQNARDLLKELVEINTSESVGSTSKAAFASPPAYTCPLRFSRV